MTRAGWYFDLFSDHLDIIAHGNVLMAKYQIRYEDGAAYERRMGAWSRLVGEMFLDWLAPPSGLKWIDIGCGNGAFTEILVNRCAPAEPIQVEMRSMGFTPPRPPNSDASRMETAVSLAFVHRRNAGNLGAADLQ
jgi:hypothetical protein